MFDLRNLYHETLSSVNKTIGYVSYLISLSTQEMKLSFRRICSKILKVQSRDRNEQV